MKHRFKAIKGNNIFFNQSHSSQDSAMIAAFSFFDERLQDAKVKFITSILENDFAVNFVHDDVTFFIEPHHHEVFRDSGMELIGTTWKCKK